jgi:hypothetical protein
MVGGESDDIDFLVTPNHRMVISSDDNNLVFKKAKDLDGSEWFYGEQLVPQRSPVIYITPYSGMVYCVTVPNGTLVVRRNKKPMVCGNCIDVLRYAAIAGIDHVDETRNLATRQGAGGY